MAPKQVVSPNILRGENRRVLLADDDPIGLEIVSKALLRHGFYVMTAKDGVSAFEMATQYAYGLILLDIQMPHLDGASVAEKKSRYGTSINIRTCAYYWFDCACFGYGEKAV